MLAINIRDDETRSQLHENIIAPFTSSQGVTTEHRHSSVSPVESQSPDETNIGNIDSNIISNDLTGNSESTIKSKKWKFENYKLENWEKWREIPFHLQEGEETSKYFRYERIISSIL